jgi:hypothetical protein
MKTCEKDDKKVLVARSLALLCSQWEWRMNKLRYLSS